MDTIYKFYIGISILAFFTKRKKWCKLIGEPNIQKSCQVFAGLRQ